MRFHLRRKSGRTAALQSFDPDRPEEDPAKYVDVEHWAEAADGYAEPDIGSGDSDPGSLRDKLLAVLDDENASLIPPSAGDMTRRQWEELSDAERERFRRIQLGRVDPRFIPSSLSNAGRRSTRVYR